jgi:ligand-binding SRPBCC domain-containing protein
VCSHLTDFEDSQVYNDMPIYEGSFNVKAPLQRVWDFHADPVSLPKVMTGPVKMDVVHVDRPLMPGGRIQTVMRVGPIKQRWNLTLKAREPMRFFTDEQIAGEGPMKVWKHTHGFEAVDGGTRIKDRLEYELPLGVLGKIAGALFGNLTMRMMFASRAKATRRLLETERAAPKALEAH